jgi:hypothetical protein
VGGRFTQSFTQQIHTPHIRTKIIRRTNYTNLIQPNHSHKIHKLQHQFDTTNHNGTTTRAQEPPFQISQEHNVNRHKNLVAVPPAGSCLATCHHRAGSQPLARTRVPPGLAALTPGPIVPAAIFPYCRVGRPSLRRRPPACAATCAWPPLCRDGRLDLRYTCLASAVSCTDES